MITQEYVLPGGARTCKVTRPEGPMLMAWNPHYIELEFSDDSVTEVELYMTAMNGEGSTTYHSIKAAVYKKKARIYISRIMQLFFFDPAHRRSTEVSVAVMIGDWEMFDCQYDAIWGSIAIGQRFNSFGTYKFDRQRPYQERTRVWFKNFPFSVSVFQRGTVADVEVIAKQDGSAYNTAFTPRIYQPRVTAIVESLNDYDIDIECISQDVKTGSVSNVIYSIAEKAFLVSDSEHFYYKKWTGENADFWYKQSSFYNDDNGNAYCDRLFSCQGKLFKPMADGSVDYLPYARQGFLSDGLYELFPSYTFPNAVASATYKQIGKQGDRGSSVFDCTFDYTFFSSSEYATITRLIVNHEKSGFYLRWVDNFGCINYYLFTKGKLSDKNKVGSTEKYVDEMVGDMYFPNLKRVTSIESTKTCKCCASFLSDDVYEYVETIVASPMIDLYIGKDKQGREIWCPVNIVAASHDFEISDVLHDLEISFTLPTYNSQSL